MPRQRTRRPTLPPHARDRQRAERLEEWSALPAADVFEVEYWDLEQAKLAQAGPRKPFAGEIALVTGAASGSAAPARWSSSSSEPPWWGSTSATPWKVADSPAYLGVQADVCSEADLERAFDLAVGAFGDWTCSS